MIVAALMLAGVGMAGAQSDVIKQRQDLMKQAGAAKYPSLFPDNSKMGGDTAALPAVWDKKADFDAKAAAWGKQAAAGAAAIKDEASFKATFPNLLKDCGGCHESFRAKKG